MKAPRCQIPPAHGVLFRARALLLLLALLPASFLAFQHTRDESAIRGAHVVPLTTVSFAGHRYVAGADLGLAKPVPLMIHGNARMFLALTHDIGEKICGGPVKKVEDFGYSAKGKGFADVPRMRWGASEYTALHNVPVFDFTERGDTLVEGMVGVPFLAAENAAIDFSRDVMILGVEISEQPSRRLLGEGYRYAPITITPDHRVTMEAYFPSIDSVLTITPSTVANALTLHVALFARKLRMKKDTTSPDRSPSGTTPDVFAADRVEFEVAGVKLSSPATLEDFGEYANVPESKLDTVGMLGFDWMKQHEAIIDYANRLLYFKP